MTEDQIIDLIIDRYLEKYPRKRYYGVKLATNDHVFEHVYYHELDENEKEIVRRWQKEKDDWDSFDDFLSDIEGGEKLKLFWLDVINPYGYEKVEDCNLNDIEYFTTISVHVLGKDGTISRQFPYSKSMNDEEFRQIVKLSILRKNQLSVNMLTCLMPEFTSDMMVHIIVDYNDGVYDITDPFCVEMTEIKDIVDSILNPKRDVLDLFNGKDKEVQYFVKRHAIASD